MVSAGNDSGMKPARSRTDFVAGSRERPGFEAIVTLGGRPAGHPDGEGTERDPHRRVAAASARCIGELAEQVEGLSVETGAEVFEGGVRVDSLAAVERVIEDGAGRGTLGGGEGLLISLSPLRDARVLEVEPGERQKERVDGLLVGTGRQRPRGAFDHGDRSAGLGRLRGIERGQGGVTRKLGVRLQGLLLKSPADGVERRCDRLRLSLGLGEEREQHLRGELGRRLHLPLSDPIAELGTAPGGDGPAGEHRRGVPRPRRDRTNRRRVLVDNRQRSGEEENLRRSRGGEHDVAQGLIHRDGRNVAALPEAFELLEAYQALSSGAVEGAPVGSRRQRRASGAGRERENDDRRSALKYFANGAERELEAIVVGRETGDLGDLLEPFGRRGRCAVARRWASRRPAS